MKKIAFIGLLLLTATQINAQSKFDQNLVDAYLKEADDHAALYYAPLEQPFNATRWENDPFWESAEGSIGTVYYDGVLYKDVMMRFNVAQQQLAVATPKNKILVCPDMSKIEYFTLFDQHFERIDGRFAAMEFSDGNGVEFWNAKEKIKGPDVFINNHSYNSYIENDYYYLKIDGVMHKVKKAKDIAKLFPTAKSTMMKQLRETEYSIQGNKHNAMLYVLRFLPKR